METKQTWSFHVPPLRENRPWDIMNPSKNSRSNVRVAPMMALLGAGILIVGLTAYTIISLTAPQKPESFGEIAPPQNNTPFVGKQW